MKIHFTRNVELALLGLILYSVGTHLVELEFTNSEHGSGFLRWSDYVVTVLFTLEYLARWIGSRKLFYPFQPMAIIDLLAVLPFYIGFLVDLRALRLFRALRLLPLFKLYRYTHAARKLSSAFHRIRHEFAIIGFTTLTLGWFGSIAIYEFERAAQPDKFGKLSDAAWFVLTTITTVGYGDRVPETNGGRLATACVMIGGLGLFGTCVSLIGSAFLEEIRQARARAKATVVTTNTSSIIATMNVENFDAHSILQIIKSAPATAHGIHHSESLRLLELACQCLLKEKKPTPA